MKAATSPLVVVGTALVTAVWLVGAAPAAELAPDSGRYGDLLLARDPDSGALSGFAKADEVGNGTEKAPQFSCRFAIRGQAASAGHYDIVAWLPGERASPESGPFKGKLTTTDTGVTLTFAKPPGGCQYRFVDGAADYDRDNKHDWRSIAVVSAEKAYFFAKPNERGGQKSFLVRGDAVGIIQVQTGWFEVEYTGDHHTTRGWIAARDLYPDRPAP